MKGIISRTVAAAGLLGVAGLLGCCGYKDVVDPCYPERYNWAAQGEVCEPLGTQINNGHILDQTMWNHYFETGKAKLNPAGLDKLDQLVQRRPYPDPTIYIATARDIPYLSEAPVETYVQARTKLNADRAESVKKYLATQERPGQSVPWVVWVNDAETPSLRAPAMLNSMTGMTKSFTGSLAGGAAATAGGGTPPQ